MDAIEHGLNASSQLQTMRERGYLSALDQMQKEISQLWTELEAAEERAEKRAEKLSDAQWTMAKWGGALVATTLLSIVLRKVGLA